MDFSEIGEKLGGLTADQAFELAKFGKDILSHSGIFGLSSGLLGLVKDIINADDSIFDENKPTIETLLHIVDMTNDLSEKCWGERKTPYGLTGVKGDNQYFGLNNETNIKAI